MADHSAQMETLKKQSNELAAMRGHANGSYTEYGGGAVTIAQCTKCNRHTWVEIYPSGHDTRGPGLTTDCPEK
jgi:hypothetical protein